MYTLDFSLAGGFSAPAAFVRLSDVAESAFPQLPETAARAGAAVHFSYWAGDPADQLPVPQDERMDMRAAYLRAASGEFVSMEDAAKRDFLKLGLGTAPPTITESRSPLLHALHELRNANFHVVTVHVAQEEKPAIWQFDGAEHEFNYSLTLVEGFDVVTFRKLRNAKRYSSATISDLVGWFLAQQREWGVPHMIVLAVDQYIRELAIATGRAA